MFNTNFTCSRCGASVTKDTSVCPKCHARLAGIRCKNCGYMGGSKDFVNDRCPKCRSVVNTSGAAPAQPKYCPKCRRTWDGSFCENCGKTDWTTPIFYLIGAIFLTLFALAGLFSLLFEDPDTQSILFVLFGFGGGSIWCWYKFSQFIKKRRKFQRIK